MQQQASCGFCKGVQVKVYRPCIFSDLHSIQVDLRVDLQCAGKLATFACVSDLLLSSLVM